MASGEELESGKSLSLGMLVRERRRAAGWTQRQLAEAASVGVGTVRDLEQGVSRRPRDRSLHRLADALGITPHEFEPARWRPPEGGRRTARGPGLRAQVLGPVKVWRDAVELGLGGVRQRAVLGLLLLDPGSLVSPAAITEALWVSDPPPTSAEMVQSYVSRLRAALGHGPAGGRGGVIETTGGGYRLRAADVALDLLDSRRLAGQARAALQAGDPAAACELFEAAIGCWTGEPLADVPLLRDHPAVVHVSQERAHLVGEYADVACAQGWHGRVLPHLQALAERDLLNEGAHGSLMIALAGSGQQAAALEVYERIRRRLDEQLGLLPGAALTEAHARVLRHDVVMSVRPLPAVAVGMACAPGVLSEEPEAPGGTAGQRTAGANDPGTQPVPFQLPPALPDFAGRVRELDSVVPLLVPGGDQVGVPVVVISGLPGVGKSALALQVGHKLRTAFPDGQLWAHLEGGSGTARPAGEVLGEWLRALGVHGSAIPDGTDERSALYRSVLAGRRVLVVLDDAASAAQVRPLLPGTAGCAVLVTSRRQLADLAGVRLLPLAPFTTEEATGLLEQILGADRLVAEATATGELIEGCGALPLAVRVLGAKLAARPRLPISVLARVLAHERQRLDVMQVGELSVRASLGSGFTALSEPSRRALLLLGALGADDVAEWTIAALLGQDAATAVVDELTDRCMLTVVGHDAGGQARYRLHDLLRDFAAERLGDVPHPQVRAAVQRAHRAWLQLAWLAGERMPPEPFFPRSALSPPRGVVPPRVAWALVADPVAWFRAERRNLLAVAEAACTYGDHQFAAQLAYCQAAFHHLQERHDDSARIWRVIAAAARQVGDRQAAAVAKLRLAGATVERGNPTHALGLLDECIAAFEGTDLTHLACALYWRTAAAWDLHDFDGALAHARRGVTAAESAGNSQVRLTNWGILGVALGSLGHNAEAVDACQKAVDIAAASLIPAYELAAVHKLAHVAGLGGQHQRVAELSDHERRLARQLGDIRAEALSLAVLGDAFYAARRYGRAVEVYRGALEIFRANYINRHRAVCLYKLGRTYRMLGDNAQAVRCLEECRPMFADMHLPTYRELVEQALSDCRTPSA